MAEQPHHPRVLQLWYILNSPHYSGTCIPARSCSSVVTRLRWLARAHSTCSPSTGQDTVLQYTTCFAAYCSPVSLHTTRSTRPNLVCVRHYPATYCSELRYSPASPELFAELKLLSELHQTAGLQCKVRCNTAMQCIHGVTVPACWKAPDCFTPLSWPDWHLHRAAPARLAVQASLHFAPGHPTTRLATAAVLHSITAAMLQLACNSLGCLIPSPDLPSADVTPTIKCKHNSSQSHKHLPAGRGFATIPIFPVFCLPKYFVLLLLCKFHCNKELLSCYTFYW